VPLSPSLQTKGLSITPLTVGVPVGIMPTATISIFQAVEKQKYEIAAKLIQIVVINPKEYPKI
jgi:hypothetical protein